jgi:hypothetical protein
MPRLSPCPSCHAHVLVDDRHCPHCGATLRTAGAPLAAAVVASLMLGSCTTGDDVGEPEYGVPVTEGTGTEGDTTTTTSSTTGGTESTSETETTGTATTDDPDASAGEADYGTAEIDANPGTTTTG